MLNVRFGNICKNSEDKEKLKRIIARLHDHTKQDVAQEVLRNDKSYCQTDAFGGYESLEKTPPWLRMVLCLAHAGRFFLRLIDARL